MIDLIFKARYRENVNIKSYLLRYTNKKIRDFILEFKVIDCKKT